MSMIAKDNANINIPILEAGVYSAIGSMIIDLGIQKNEKFGKSQRKFRLVWNIVGEEVEINGEKYPRTMSKEYSFSLGEKSNLRRDLQAWRGKAFTEEELRGFLLVNILNKGCQLQIINEEKNGKTYNNIASIVSLPKGTKLDELEETTVFDIEDKATWENWSKVPTWLREQIKKAENYETSGIKQFVENYEKENNIEETQEQDEDLAPKDDLPF